MWTVPVAPVPAVVFYGLLVRERIRPPPPQVVYVQYVYVQPPPPPVIQVWAPLPLSKVHVAVQAFDFCAEVTVTQTYRNDSACVLDSEYIFPLDEGSAVSAFNARIGDRIIHGQVREKAAAKAQFEQAKAQGKATALMEQRAENVFKVSIGNLDARSEITITITYVTTLELVGKANTIVIPSVVAPKYEPRSYFGWQGMFGGGGSQNSSGGFYNAPAAVPVQTVMSSAGQLNFFQSMTAQYMGVAPPPVVVAPAPVVIAAVQQVAPPRRFSMQIDLLMPARIASIVSESHASQTRVVIDALPADAVVAADGRLAVPHHARVTFGMVAEGQEGAWPESLGEKDFVLNITQAAYLSTRAVMEIDPATGSQAVQLAFCPPSLDMLDASSLRTEVVFLVDQSGSMAGSGIDAVKQLLQLFIRSLPIYSRFNIVSFGSTYRKLFPASAAYSESSINQALAYVNGMKADLGGTEIMDPLRHCFEAPTHPDYPRQIFLLTDGQVTNTQQLVDLTRTHSYQSRLFAFGLGNSVDRVLVKSLAAAGKGEHEFVGALNTPEAKSELASKVMRNLIRAMQPSLSSVTVDWSAVQAPAPPQPDFTQPGFFVAAPPANSNKVQQCPEQIAPIFAPAREVIYALNCTVARPAAGGPEQTVTLRVSAQSNRPRGDAVEGKVTWDVPLNLSRPQSGTFIHKLAARARIGELQNATRGAFYQFQSEAQIRAQVLALALKFQLLSNYTSFILVDDRRIASLRDPSRVRRGRRPQQVGFGVPAVQPALAAAQTDMFNAFMASQLTPGLPVNSNGFAFQTVGAPAAAAVAQPAAAAADFGDDDYDDEDCGEYEAQIVDLNAGFVAVPAFGPGVHAQQYRQQSQSGFGGFGVPSTAPGVSGFSFGAAPAPAAAFGFGAPMAPSYSSSSSSFGFGAERARLSSSSSNSFGGFGAPTTGGSAFGGSSGASFGSSNGGGSRGGGANYNAQSFDLFGCAPTPSPAAAPLAFGSTASMVSKKKESNSSQPDLLVGTPSSTAAKISQPMWRAQEDAEMAPPAAPAAVSNSVNLFDLFAAPAAPPAAPAPAAPQDPFASFSAAFSGVPLSPPKPSAQVQAQAQAQAAAAASRVFADATPAPSSPVSAAAAASSLSGMTLSTAFTILIQMVAVDGCWNASRELLQLLGHIARLSNQSGGVQASLSAMTVESLTASASTLGLSSVKVAATLLVSWVLSACFPARQMEWAMMDAKAKGVMRASMALNIADIPTITAKLIPGSNISA